MNLSGAMKVSNVMQGEHVETAAELYFRVAVWMAGSAVPPTADRVCQRFGVSRATAFRWLRAWTNVRMAA